MSMCIKFLLTILLFLSRGHRQFLYVVTSGSRLDMWSIRLGHRLRQRTSRALDGNRNFTGHMRPTRCFLFLIVLIVITMWHRVRYGGRGSSGDASRLLLQTGCDRSSFRSVVIYRRFFRSRIRTGRATRCAVSQFLCAIRQRYRISLSDKYKTEM